MDYQVAVELTELGLTLDGGSGYAVIRT